MENYLKSFLSLTSLGFFGLSLTAMADLAPIGKITELNLENHIVAIEVSSLLSEGDQLVVTFPDGKQCRIEATESQENRAFAKTEKCEREKEIATGMILEKDLSVQPATDNDSDAFTSNLIPGIDDALPSKNEDWYTYWGLGFNSISYLSGTDRNVVDVFRASPTASHSSVNLDLFGFYWPLEDHTAMVGVILNGVADRWSDYGGTFQRSQYTLGASAMKFFGKNIGDGWFVRADAGPAWSVGEYSYNYGPAVTYRSAVGFGALAGFGYAFPISRETRFLLGTHYSLRFIQNSGSGTFAITGGLLF